MDHHSSGTGSWQIRSAESLAPLRAPKVLGLSVNAPEFVPKNTAPPQQQQPQQSQYGSGAPQHHHQQQVRYRSDNNGSTGGGGGGGGGGTYNMIPVASHYPPVDMDNGVMVNGTGNGISKSGISDRLRNLQHSSDNQHQQGGHSNYGANKDFSENETFALEYLADVISELLDNPGMFDSIQRKLKGTFAEFRSNQFVLSNAVELIFEQSIKEQNFRYMGARLCKLLDSLDESSTSVLRELLNMKMAYQHTELHGYMTNEQIKVRGTTLFLAELYMQMRKPNDLERNSEIAMRIIAAAKVLLSKKGPENIKCVCQCLKLCGFELERDCRDQLKDILETLGELEGTTDNSTGRFIRSVLDLQQKSWGRSEEIVPVVQPPVNVPPTVADEFNDSPVFYGPDGQVMTEEENDFLETAPAAFEEYDDEEGDPDDLVDDENMDLEIKLAFREFVTGNNNRQPY